MKKAFIPIIALTLGLGLSGMVDAKEHHGPKADNQVKSQNNKHSYRHDRQDSRSHNQYRNNHQYESHRRDDRRYHHRHSDTRRHDYHYNDRYRNHYNGGPKHRHYYSYHSYPHYNSYPVSVYYLGQDWFYYEGYYHPFPRGHVHSRHCHHRYWEPLAVGIILGSVLGW